ncbi:hypothetical protein MWU38_00625 [Qipengyuania sp. S6317L1]|uniref:FliH/SctL family protein n=1 Tax=Qipengyuania sp. S6317L1 TaxID=2926410 RepID=UPI001FF247FD|nr:hypothetical protein [Qipengyuania sp. S6317L1]MCK0097874.1 hypothetical protein [Qipengyuania sp. S6317L1]
MASSSDDWLTALLERPHDGGCDGDGGGGVRTLEWLPDFGEPAQGFVEGFPSSRCAPPVAPEVPEPASDDPLVDLLREALGDGDGNDMGTGDDPEPTPLCAADAADDPEVEPEPEPEIDPVAQAFEQGKAAGREEAMAQHEAERQQKLTLRQTFRALDQAAMDALAGELAETVIALCTQTLADFVPAPEALKQRCLKAAQRLGAGAGEATLFLHPDDLALFDPKGVEGWKLVADPTAERASLRLETPDGLVSDRPEDWRRAIAAAVKG